MFVTPSCHSSDKTSGGSLACVASKALLFSLQRDHLLKVARLRPGYIPPHSISSCAWSGRRRGVAVEICCKVRSCLEAWGVRRERRVSRGTGVLLPACLRSALVVLLPLRISIQQSLLLKVADMNSAMEDEWGQGDATQSLSVETRIHSGPTSTSASQSSDRPRQSKRVVHGKTKAKKHRIRSEEAEIIRILFGSSEEEEGQTGNGASRKSANNNGGFVSVQNGGMHKKGEVEVDGGMEKSGFDDAERQGVSGFVRGGNGALSVGGSELCSESEVKEGCESCGGLSGSLPGSADEDNGRRRAAGREWKHGKIQRWPGRKTVRGHGKKQEGGLQVDVTLPVDGGLVEGILALGPDNTVQQMLDTWPRKITQRQIAAAIKCLGVRMRLEQAVELFEWADAPGRAVRPGAPMHNLVVHILTRARMLSAAEKALSTMCARGYGGGKPGLYAHNAMLDAYKRTGAHAHARKLFQRMVRDGPKPDVVSCSVMLALAVAERQPAAHVRALAREMEEEHVLDVDTRMFNVVLSALRREGLWEDVPEVLKEMKSRGCAPCEVTYNTILALYGTCARPQEARDALARMRAEGLPPGLRAYTGLVKAYANSGRMAKALEVVQEMKERDDLLPDLHMWSLLVSVHGQAGHPQEGEELLERMRVSGFSPNTVTYGALVQAYARQGMPHEAARVFNDMTSRGVPPDRRCYNALIAAFGQEGLSLHAEQIFREMQTRHIAPDGVSYNLLVRALYQAGRVEEAEGLHDAMLKAKFTADVTTKRMAATSSSTMLLRDHESPQTSKRRGGGPSQKDTS